MSKAESKGKTLRAQLPGLAGDGEETRTTSYLPTTHSELAVAIYF